MVQVNWGELFDIPQPELYDELAEGTELSGKSIRVHVRWCTANELRGRDGERSWQVAKKVDINPNCPKRKARMKTNPPTVEQKRKASMTPSPFPANKYSKHQTPPLTNQKTQERRRIQHDNGSWQLLPSPREKSFI